MGVIVLELQLIGLQNSKGKALRWNDPETAKARSKTFPGIAQAMAEQWGNYIENL